MGTGIYLHIPFCVSKCAYCDFYSLPGACHSEDLKQRYVTALKRQMAWAKSEFAVGSISSVFMGGGTPTTLKTEQLCDVISALKSAFDLTPECEFTVEANPKTFDREKLTALKSLGVNRLSIGMQSANEKELSVIGRIHTFSEVKEAVELTRNCGFDNVSLDIMYGLPYQTKHTFLSTLTEAASLSPEHLSVYGLQLEEGTPLYRKKDSLPFPSENECIEMYSEGIALLKSFGYERYEISNFSKPGRECRHNLNYWSAGEYLGLGAGAYSYLGKKRFSFEQDVEGFCLTSDFNKLLHVDEIIDQDEEVKEFIMLSLRLTKGFSVNELFDRTRDPQYYLKRFEPYVKSGYLKHDDGRIFFTEEGFNVSNAILSDILF